MKLLVVQFEEAVDISPFPKRTQVIVSNGTLTLTGEVMFAVDVDVPEPSLAGDYHIEPLVAAPARNPIKAVLKAVLRKG